MIPIEPPDRRAPMPLAWSRHLLAVLMLLMLTVLAKAESAAPTVRWLDWQQRDHFAIEGDDYRCHVDTNPSRIASLRVGDIDLLGPAGAQFEAITKDGRRLAVTPPDVVPDWRTWQGQRYRPATASRGRMNVWRAGPWYWDA